MLSLQSDARQQPTGAGAQVSAPTQQELQSLIYQKGLGSGGGGGVFYRVPFNLPDSLALPGESTELRNGEKFSDLIIFFLFWCVFSGDIVYGGEIEKKNSFLFFRRRVGGKAIGSH